MLELFGNILIMLVIIFDVGFFYIILKQKGNGEQMNIINWKVEETEKEQIERLLKMVEFSKQKVGT